jgi:hypothetical protein
MALEPTELQLALDDVGAGLARAMSGRKRLKLDDQEAENFDPAQILRAERMLQHRIRRENGQIPTAAVFNFTSTAY